MTAVEPRRAALRAWLLLRTGLSTVVLGLAYALFSSDSGVEQAPTTIIIETIVAFSIVSSFVVAGYAEQGGRLRIAGAVLLVLDIALVSASVGVTGGAASVLAVLYGAVILAAATTLGSRAAFLAGGLSLASYSVIAFGMALSYLPHPPDQPSLHYQLPPADLAFSVLSNVAAMSIVAMLSYWLAAQLDRTGGALVVAESDRERLSARNDSIVRSIASGLLTTDGSGRITSVNPAGIDILGLPYDDAIGAELARFFPRLELEATPTVERIVATGRRADGTEFPTNLWVTRLSGPGAIESESLVTFHDLTEMMRLEAAARDSEQLATLGRVAATLAHEIRNPLGSISGSVELVRENPILPEEDKHLLSIVVREVDRIDQLVRDMLDVARRRDVRFEQVDLVELCSEVAAIAPRTDSTTVRVLVDSVSPLVAIVDRDMIKQVVWNLVRNAMQASPADGTVRLGISAREHGGFELVVEDDGPGIPSAELDRIFDAFHTGRTRGVGLGLAVVRQIVAMHEGTVSAENRKLGGARFSVRIPHLRELRPSDPEAAVQH